MSCLWEKLEHTRELGKGLRLGTRGIRWVISWTVWPEREGETAGDTRF